MRKYTIEKERKIVDIKCNKCGKNIKVENNIVTEGVFSVDYKWDYFSNMDGEIHSFDLCEDCYKKFLESFMIKAVIEEGKELL